MNAEAFIFSACASILRYSTYNRHAPYNDDKAYKIWDEINTDATWIPVTIGFGLLCR